MCRYVQTLEGQYVLKRNDMSGNACFEWDVLLDPEFKQLNKSFETLCHNGQKFREKSGNVQRGKECNHIDKYRSQYVDEVKTLASNIENLSKKYTRLPKPNKDHGGLYRGEFTSKRSSFLGGLGRRNTGKEPSAQEILDMQIRLENQDLKKQLTDLEINGQVLEQRYADQERRLEAEIQENNNLSVRCAEQERRLEAELQEKNDLSVRHAYLASCREAELQEKNDLSVRYAYLESRVEAELQEKIDLSVRTAGQEGNLRKEKEMRHTEKAKADKSQSREEFRIMEEKQRYTSSLPQDIAEITMPDSLQTAPKPQVRVRGHLELSEKSDCVGGRLRFRDIDQKLEHRLQKNQEMERKLANLYKYKAPLVEKYTDLERRLEAKNDLSVRFSTLIASRNQDRDTSVVDLSDEYRPTKLAEYFSELYDNEWTDCFDELENQAIEESESIRILLKILTDIFNVCLQWSTENYFLLVQRAIDRTYIDKEKLPPREKEKVELPDDLLQPIKEIKKRRALKVLPTIHEFVRRKIPTLVQARFASTYFQTYIQKCTEFSWLAVVQDPPLVLLTDGGTKFDGKLFKEYMRRGQFVEFVVWPALLVGEGGAVLSKGVAQGTNKPQ